MSDGGDRGGAVTTTPATVVVWWVVSLGLYLGVVSGVTWWEVLAGALVSGLAVGASLAALRGAGIGFVGTPPALHRLAAVGRIVGREVVSFSRAFAGLLRGRQPDSRWVAVAYDEPMEAGADASLTIEAALAPNTLLVETLEGRTALLHQLEATAAPASSFPRWAGPGTHRGAGR